MGGDLWEAIGAIGEAFSAIGLFFVLVQVRHARAEVQRSISENRASAATQLMLNRITNESVRRMYSKGNAALQGRLDVPRQAMVDKAGLSGEEADMAFFDQLAWWQHVCQIVRFRHDLSPAEMLEADTGIRGIYSLPRLWYETTKPTLNPDAVRYVDDVLARSDRGATH